MQADVEISPQSNHLIPFHQEVRRFVEDLMAETYFQLRGDPKNFQFQ